MSDVAAYHVLFPV